MKNDDILDAIGDVRDEFIAEANRKKINPVFKWAGAVAACAAVVIGILALGGGIGGNDAAPGNTSGGGGSGHDEGTVFMSYAGPVFPLNVTDGGENITAERNVNYDLSVYDTNIYMGSSDGITVNDDYVLYNAAVTDMEVTAVYPFAGDMREAQWPTITVDGAEAEWELVTGDYSGNFMGAGDEISTSRNLDSLNSWEQYKALLSDGSYYAAALEMAPELDRKVTVYKFTDVTGGEGIHAATLCCYLDYDKEKTSVLTYGFNGGSIGDGPKENFRDFFIGADRPDGNEPRYLVVVGDDLKGYSIQGFEDGGCDPGEEIDGVSATVTRIETTLGDILRELSRQYFEGFDGTENGVMNGRIDFETYYNAVCEHFSVHGPLGTDPKERYEFGMLEDIIGETQHHDRVFYARFTVTVPASGSADVKVSIKKRASFDFYCSGSGNVGLNGYDMVTELGSSLKFLGQTASISNYDTVTIERQNFGFDISAGVTEVTLDPAVEHYYMELRKK